MKKCGLFLIIVVALFNLSGCATPRTIRSSRIANHCTAYFGISIGFPFRTQNTKLKEIETDSYGRQLIWIERGYLDFEIPMEKDFYVIQQRYDKKGVYFYEDIAWCFADIEEEAFNQWKDQNDWEKPIQEDKLSNRHCHIITEGKVIKDGDTITGGYSNPVNMYMKSRFATERRKVRTYWFVDYDEKGKELWIVRFEQENEEDIVEEEYVIITKGEGISAETLSVSEALTDRSKLTQFKYDHGWSYPSALIQELLSP